MMVWVNDGEDLEWVDDDPTEELPIVVVADDLAPPQLPPARPPFQPPVSVGSWQALRETTGDLFRAFADVVSTFFRALAWLLRVLRPVLPILAAVVMLAAVVRLVPWSNLEDRVMPDLSGRPTSAPTTTTTTTVAKRYPSTTEEEWYPTTTEPAPRSGQRVVVVRPG